MRRVRQACAAANAERCPARPVGEGIAAAASVTPSTIRLSKSEFADAMSPYKYSRNVVGVRTFCKNDTLLKSICAVVQAPDVVMEPPPIFVRKLSPLAAGASSA